MKLSKTLPIILAATLMSMTGLAHAQNTKPPVESTRAAAFMDRDAFLATHRWDGMTGLWVLRSDVEMPKGVRPRSEVMTMTEVFLSKNRWDESTSQWMPIAGSPRDMSKLTREQVRMETVRFLMMYYYDESSSEWVSHRR